MSEAVLQLSVTGDYIEREYQTRLHDGMEDFSQAIIIAHRRAGKTVVVIAQLIRDVFSCGLHRPQVAYVANTYKQAKNVAWLYFQDMLKHVPNVKYSKQDLSIVIPSSDGDPTNVRTIFLLGSENPDRLRGMYLDSACVDEMATAPASLITKILRPCLADRAGKLYLIGTVSGMNHFWKQYEKARDSEHWFSALLLPEDTHALSDDAIAVLKREMSDEEYRSEMLCDPTAAVLGSFYAKVIRELSENDQVCHVPFDQALPVCAAFDLGIADATAIWFAQLHRGGEIRIIDHCEYTNTGFIQILDEVRKLYNITRWIGPHDLRVREYTSGQSRVDAASEIGIEFEIAPMLPVIDGIEAVRRALPRCWFDEEKTQYGVECLTLYHSSYDDKRRVLSRNPVHDYTSHSADAFRYLITATDGGRPDLFHEQPQLDYGKY